MAGDGIDVDKAIEAARKFPGLKGMDLAKEVCTRERYEWREGQLDLDRNAFAQADAKFHVVAYDFGVQAQHPAHARRARLPRDRGAGADAAPRKCSR